MSIKPIRQCPKRQGTETEQNWYHHLTAKNLGICSHCYHTHLARSPFAIHFGHEHDTSWARRICDFDTPRTHTVLREATHQNDFSIFEKYWVQRAQIPRCKGPGVSVSAEDNIAWYEIKDAQDSKAGRFVACQSCFEDHVVPSRFRRHFSDTPVPQPDNSTIACDMALEFCQKLLAGSGEWHHTSTWLYYRINLPKCTGVVAVDGSSRRWHKLRFAEFDSASMLSCEACYYDCVHNSIAAEHFDPSPFAMPPGSQVVCMIGGNIPMRVLLDEAIYRRDWAVFHRAAQVSIRSPLCRKEGTQSPIWYSLIPADAEIDICPSCHACLFEALSAAHVLQPKHMPPGGPAQLRLCNMNLATPHALSMYTRLDRAIDTGDFAIFTNFARQVANVAPCPGGTPQANRHWYTNATFTCCPACWLTAPIQGTKFAGCFSPPTQVSNALKCDFYSERVRHKWRMACLEDALPEFTDFMKKRLEIWQQTYPQIQQQLQMMRMNMERQSALMMASVINTGANNLVAASAPVSLAGHYGNSAIGYNYETMAGAQGAMQFNQGVNMNAANGSPMMAIAQLEGLWKSVE